VSAITGTSSIDRGLTIGADTPGGTIVHVGEELLVQPHDGCSSFWPT